MTISLSNTGKRFNREWIFRQINYTFHSGNAYAITGQNGSGKSTLLQVIAGAIMPNEGTVQFSVENQKPIESEHMFRYVSVCAPYLEVVEEMTLREMLDFHQQFKPLLPQLTTSSVIDVLGLNAAADKQIRFFSSGMKQRVKLAQCILSQTEIVLLDEPCTNLDEAGIRLYLQLIEQYTANRIVIVSSNDKTEYGFAKNIVRLSDFKS